MTNALYTLDDSPTFEWIRLSSTDSTINFLRHYRPVTSKEMVLVTSDFQTAGRGQAHNSWESEAGKNLLLGLLVHPTGISANRQFVLSQAMSLAVRDTLAAYADGFTVKWPNDIYWRNSKICGMLIENTLAGNRIEECILGVGVNVNQTVFKSDAPNPISLAQVTGKEHERIFILAEIVKSFKKYFNDILSGQTEEITGKYLDSLYAKEGFHPYADANGTFEARIAGIEPTGHLLLSDRQGIQRRYAFKEVSFLIPTDRKPQI